MTSLAGPCVAQRVWLMPVRPVTGPFAQQLHQVGDAAGVLAHLHAAVIEDGQAGAVVAAVLQTVQAVQEGRFRFLAADVADDAAHGPFLRQRSVW